MTPIVAAAEAATKQLHVDERIEAGKTDHVQNVQKKPDREGRIPLHYAAMKNDVAAVQSRLAAGDDPDSGDRLGFTPLHLAAQEGAVEAMKVLQFSLNEVRAWTSQTAMGTLPCSWLSSIRGVAAILLRFSDNMAQTHERPTSMARRL